MKMALIGLLTLAAWAGDLNTVRAEPNLEKRARLAMEHANAMLTLALKDYAEGAPAKAIADLAVLRDAVELCGESLNATGKDARKNPRAFKRAELDTRALLRRIESTKTDFGVEDRGAVEATEQALHAFHDRLIDQIMTKK